MSDGADLILVQFAERKTCARHLFLLQAEKKIGLILGIVGGAKKFVALRGFIEADARVVSGDQSISANFAGGGSTAAILPPRQQIRQWSKIAQHPLIGR